MALSASTVWEVRTGGADDNGGGFVTGASGTDWSQQNSKRTGGDVTDISTTDAVANGTTTITSATANFAATIVGNVICLAGGTGSLTKGWYHVTARTDATTITVDRTVATGTGIAMNIGGAVASIGMIGGVAVASNTIWVKAGTYTITSTSANVSGGVINFTQLLTCRGYDTTRGDNTGTKPLLQADGVIVTFTIVTQGSNGAQFFGNINVDGNSRSSSNGFSMRGMIWNCKASNCTQGFTSVVTCLALECEATGCTSGGFVNAGYFVDCLSYSNTSNGFDFGVNDVVAVRCLSYNNTGATTDGFASTNSSGKVVVFACNSYNNGRHGFNLANQRGLVCVNCISEDNGGWGFILTNPTGHVVYNAATYSNTSGGISGTPAVNINPIAGSASFFVNAASLDFKPNNVAGAGALLRGTGGIDVNSIIGYSDVGALQHRDPGGEAFSMIGI